MEKEAVRPRAVVKSATAFRTISEVSDELEVPQHVLRFWETKFPQVRPLKRGGGRRYYRPEDVTLLRRIQRLLYSEGYTIKGVQRLLKDPHSRDSDGEAEVFTEENTVGIPEEVATDTPDEFVGEIPDADADADPDGDGDDGPAEAEDTAEVGDTAQADDTVEADDTLAAEVEAQTPVAALVPVYRPEAISAAPPPLVRKEVSGALSTWHRRELLALRSELLDIKSALLKMGR